MWTYQNICVSDARRIDDVLSDEHDWKTTD